MQPLSRRSRSPNPRPPDWAAAFGRRMPLEVDLGSGRGAYALERARRFPNLCLVALETRAKWIRRIRSQAALEGLSNLRAIRCDIRFDLPLLFGPGSVHGFTLFHPDPWWKKRHRKRRLIQPEQVDLLAELLEPGGWIFAQTDVPDLAEEMAGVLDADPRFSPLDAALFRRQLGDFSSDRERRCQQLHIPIRRMAFRRNPLPGGSGS